MQEAIAVEEVVKGGGERIDWVGLGEGGEGQKNDLNTLF